MKGARDEPEKHPWVRRLSNETFRVVAVAVPTRGVRRWAYRQEAAAIGRLHLRRRRRVWREHRSLSLCVYELQGETT